MSTAKTAPWVCRSCGTMFSVSHDMCVSCGSRKLYDSELKGAWADNERLRAQVAKLREALKPFLGAFETQEVVIKQFDLSIDDLFRIRAALKETE